jgi:deoxyribonuclease V
MDSGKKYPEYAASDCLRAVDAADAEKKQEVLRHRDKVERMIDSDEIRLIAGADAAYDQDTIYAAVVVMTFPWLDVVEKTCSVQAIPFPYIPGLLAFREGPAIVDAFRTLSVVPDLILLNGHGYAHPKRFGMASHVGVVLDIPSIGVAQRLLIGNGTTPGAVRGSTEPVFDRHVIIGMAVRSREETKPVYVSAGYRVDLVLAVDIVLKTTVTHRLTEPIWQADQWARRCRNINPGNGSKKEHDSLPDHGNWSEELHSRPFHFTDS